MFLISIGILLSLACVFISLLFYFLFHFTLLLVFILHIGLIVLVLVIVPVIHFITDISIVIAKGFDNLP